MLYARTLIAVLILLAALPAPTPAAVICLDPASGEESVLGTLSAQDCGAPVILTAEPLTPNEELIVLPFYTGIPAPVGSSGESRAQSRKRNEEAVQTPLPQGEAP